MKPQSNTIGWADSLFVEPIAPVKREPAALLYGGKWYSDGKLLWDCSDCLCFHCANDGESCHDCKGFRHCMEHGGKITACPDYRGPMRNNHER